MRSESASPHSVRHSPANAASNPARIASPRLRPNRGRVATVPASNANAAACHIRWPIARIDPPEFGMKMSAGTATAIQSAASVRVVIRRSASHRAAATPNEPTTPATTSVAKLEPRIRKKAASK